jgi:TIR domain/Sel1 repeat
MSGKIFISYRREDSSAWAGRLYDRLSAHFAQSQIFMDVDIDLGINFAEEIEKSVGSCDVFIAVIGRHWLTSVDEEGRRRLDSPRDFVRLEIGTALKRGIRVIPVLVEGVSMRQFNQLPEDLKSLTLRNALNVNHDRFGVDADRLIQAVERVLEDAQLEKDAQLEQERQRQEQARWLAKAKRYFDAEGYAKALPLFRKAAKTGDTDAMNYLGYLYQNGLGVVRNHSQACRWF